MGEDTAITLLLEQMRAGNERAESRFVDAVYPELRRIASRYLRAERPGHSLQATALVNEAYVRLAGQMEKEWKNRSHFFAVAATLIRRILVDYARTRNAQKRAGGRQRVDLTESLFVSEERLDEVLAIHTALERLATWDLRQSRVVELRFFAGLTEEEIAEVLNVNLRTVKRDWKVARAWLHAELTNTDSAAPTE
jgi:RNA polymerase sigma factor (TIGR02999 family)